MAAPRLLLRTASALAAVTGCICLTTASAAEPTETQLAGTYQVIICRGPCSFASVKNAVVEGVFVLLADRIERSEGQKLDVGFQPVLSGGKANGCYLLRRLANRDYAGYANTRGPALTVWSQRNDGLHLALFRSTDAGYEVVLRGDTGALSGTGQSWGAGVAAPADKTVDQVIARRVGPAEIGTCGFGARRYLQVE